MHMQRRTKAASQMTASPVLRPPPSLALSKTQPNRFARTVSAAQVTPRADIAAYQAGYRDCAERNRAMLRELASALEEAMAVGWPDDAEPRNAAWRRLIWRARRTPK